MFNSVLIFFPVFIFSNQHYCPVFCSSSQINTTVQCSSSQIKSPLKSNPLLQSSKMAQDNTSSNPSIHGKEIANSNTDPTRLNVSNPFSSHQSDHPGLVLISKPLNGNNYSTWKRAMMLALNSKNKLGFVDGTIN